jgi:hypothetical protein|tara:strand:+ start:2339 stop:2503 length:165 start_codon:yes stop_codon:yes gene_type:complete
MAHILPKDTQEERRKGPESRRVATEDRRHSERVADDINPRRNPDTPGRRSADTR